MFWLHGIGHFNPENEITNRFLEELDIGTTDAWITERVGIRSRRTVLPLDYIRSTYNRDTRAAVEAALYTNAQTGKRAAEMAIARAGLQPSDIGMIIGGGCAPDTTAPAEACTIGAELEIDVPAIDVNSACSTFGAHLFMLSRMRPETLPPFVLAVIVDNTTRVVDYSDRRGAVLWGDGSTATVISTQHPGRFALEFNMLDSQPSGARKVMIPRTGHFVQDGQAVQKFAISRTIKCLKEIQDKFSDVPTERFHFIGHQANRLMLDYVCRSCEITPQQHHSNVGDFGNTGAAGSPSVFSRDWDQFTEGDHVAVVGVGSGLTWASTVFRCAHGAGAPRPAPAAPTQDLGGCI